VSSVASTSSRGTREKLRAAVVYKPGSAHIEAYRRHLRAEETKRGRAHARWFATSATDRGDEAIRRAIAMNPDVVIVLGGDGTIRRTAEVLADTDIPLAVLPAGTGNLFARNLGIPLLDHRRAVQAALRGKTVAIDVAEADLWNGPDHRHARFLVMAGIGFDADMAAHADPATKRRLGWLAYVKPVVRSVWKNNQQELKFCIDGNRRRTIRAHTAIIGNCGLSTGNVALFPHARFDDGLLDFVVMNPRTFGGWTRIWSHIMVMSVLSQTPGVDALVASMPSLKSARYAQGSMLDVDIPRAQNVQLDGDYFGQVTSMRIAVNPGALKVRVAR
jgi:diacylglycerol kinase (ATP)